MKTNQLRLVCTLAASMLLLALLPKAARAQEGEFRLGGKLLLDDRISTRDAKLHWQEYRLRLNPSYSDGKRYNFYADVWARRLISQSPFEKKPSEIELREAYVELYGFLLKDLDITIGRQRIAWGAADRLNPTDNINPIQLEDFWDLSRHSPRSALHLRYYVGPVTISGVYLPQFGPANLPATKWLDLMTGDLPRTFQAEVPLVGSLSVLADPLTVQRRYLRPEWTPNSSTYALRVAADLGPVSLSASWLRGPSHIPHLAGVDVQGTLRAYDPIMGQATVQADAALTLAYPIRHVFGLDAAGAIGSVGVWAEAAAFLPEEALWAPRRVAIDPTALLPSMPIMQRSLDDTLTLEDKPFVKYTVGADYTFPINLYVNVQYAHGLAHEEGKDNLHDHLVWVMEWTGANERLKVAPLNGMIRIDSFDRLSDTYSLFLLPEVSYSPIDNCTITLGAHLLLPAKESKLYTARKFSEAFCKVIFTF